ncbi:MAG: DUF1284 domain-containing protein [Brevinematia bacterium]
MKRFLELRAHHILCIQGFQGYGYDGQFTKNLYKIHSGIFDKKVRLIIRNDEICKFCPFSSDSICFKRKNGKRIDIRKLDIKVLKILKIRVNAIKAANVIFRLTNSYLKDRLKKLCSDCEWQKKCLWYLS